MDQLDIRLDKARECAEQICESSFPEPFRRRPLLLFSLSVSLSLDLSSSLAFTLATIRRIESHVYAVKISSIRSTDRPIRSKDFRSTRRHIT